MANSVSRDRLIPGTPPVGMPGSRPTPVRPCDVSIHLRESHTGTDTRPCRHAAKASLHNGTDRVKKAARQAAGNTDQFVNTNPSSVVGIAAAAGAAIAVLLSSRMSR